MSQVFYPLQELDWDTKFFGAKMGEVYLSSGKGVSGISLEAMQQTLKLAREQDYKFLLCQFDTIHQEMAAILVGLGATVGDVLLTLDRDLSLFLTQNEGAEFQIRKAIQSDLPEIQAISGNSFKYSRFFQDSRFDGDKVRQFYHQWIADSFMTNEEFFVLTEERQVQGYISIQPQIEESAMVIRLLAVRETKHGQGMGNTLVQWAIHHAAKQGLRRIQVGTQVNNYSAVRLYEKNGFRLKNAKYRLHIWLDSLPKAEMNSTH